MKRTLLIILCFLVIHSSRSIIHAQKFEGLAKTPPMGWSSWNNFGCTINEEIIMSMADAMVSSGMKEAGYEYINIDDCWHLRERDESGNVMAILKSFHQG